MMTLSQMKNLLERAGASEACQNIKPGNAVGNELAVLLSAILDRIDYLEKNHDSLKEAQSDVDVISGALNNATPK
jgi:hypothetical protein